MTSSTMSIGDPLESLLWDVVCSDVNRWNSRPARRTLRVLHVVNGEHYAGAERVQDLLAARLPEVGVEVAFACLKPNRFPRCGTAKPRRGEFADALTVRFAPAWRLARMIRQEIRPHSYAYAAGGLGGSNRRQARRRAHGASRAWSHRG